MGAGWVCMLRGHIEPVQLGHCDGQTGLCHAILPRCRNHGGAWRQLHTSTVGLAAAVTDACRMFLRHTLA